MVPGERSIYFQQTKGLRMNIRMSKESKATPKEFWINLSQSNGFELQLFNRKYTVWLSCEPENYKDTQKDAEFIEEALNYYKQERAKSARLLEVIKQVKVHLRAPVHFDALVQMSQICGDAIEEYNQSEGGDER